MKNFINDDFLLGSRTARRLYHEYAENQPIIDFHCHLSPAMIADDRQFDNLGQAWLEGDHYKWRAMRTNGISEHYCTGDATPAEKFENGLKQFRQLSGIPCTTGPTSNWRGISGYTTCSPRRPLQKYTRKHHRCSEALSSAPGRL